MNVHKSQVSKLFGSCTITSLPVSNLHSQIQELWLNRDTSNPGKKTKSVNAVDCPIGHLHFFGLQSHCLGNLTHTTLHRALCVPRVISKIQLGIPVSKVLESVVPRIDSLLTITVDPLFEDFAHSFADSLVLTPSAFSLLRLPFCRCIA